MREQNSAHFWVLVLAFIHYRLLGHGVDEANVEILLRPDPVAVEQLQAVVDPVVGLFAVGFLLLLHEAHEGGALDLHGLPLPVVQSQDEVEKVGFPQVGRRLLLEVSPGQTHSATLPGGRGGSQPALHGGERSAPAARCPAERHAPATSQSRLEAVTGAPMCLIFQFQSC